MSVKRSRFSDANWFRIGPQEIIVGGTGGIGSWASLFLARIGHTLYLFDDDNIEEVNMAGQLYKASQIGKNKAIATKDNIYEFSGNTNVEVMGRYVPESPTSPIVFSCFDNMKARKLMFEKWASQEDRELFVDGRMLAETGMVFLVQKGQEEAYRRELFEDSEVEDAPCSFKATSHCGAFIGSLMVSGLNNYLNNKFMEFEASIVQFRTDFELPLFTLMEVSESPNLIITNDKPEESIKSEEPEVAAAPIVG